MKPGDWQFSLRNLDPEPPQPRYVPKAKPKPKPEPRRTKSMPAPKQFIPSESMGDYEDMNRRKSAPSKPQHLFPLNEEGTYGRPPAAPAPPTPKKERKPKIYAGYAIDSSCDLHAKKMAKVEQQVEREREEQRSRRRRNSFRRNVSASPSRASSRAGSEARESIRDSKSPDPQQQNGGPVRRKSSVGSADGMSSRKSSGGRAYSSQTHQSSSSSHKRSSSIREEKEEYSYKENRKMSGYSKYAANDALSNGVNGMSLDGLRKPKIDSWDSMGILGLTSKMWNDTSKQQETFMSSTGLTLREETSTYIM